MPQTSLPSKPHSWRSLGFKLIAIVCGLCLPLIVGEVVVRFLPIHTGLHSLPVNDQNPVYHFQPNRQFTYSSGWDFKNVRRRRTNNVGFVSDIDYVSESSKPLLAIVGDSYIEALQVEFNETVHGRLGQRLGDRGRVYAFAAGIAPLSQYLAWADYARQTFHPDALVVNVVGNDFNQSLLWVQQSSARSTFGGMHYFAEGPAHRLELVRVDLEKDPFREVLKGSALMQYLARNVGVQNLRRQLSVAWQLWRSNQKSPVFVGNVQAEADERLIADSKRVVDAFVALLPEKIGLPPNRIILTVDGLRPQLYDEGELRKASSSYFAIMRRYLIETASNAGSEVIDLQPRFIERFRKTQERVEWSFDNHWNIVGHEVMADSVAESKVFASTFLSVK